MAKNEMPRGGATQDAAVMKRAIQLQTRDQQRAEAAADQQALTEAAEELGVPARYVVEATAELAAERRATQVRRRRLISIGAGAAAVVASLVFGSVAMRGPAPPPPAEYSLAAGAGHWTLHKNAGTAATLRFEPLGAGEGGQQAAVIAVARFAPEGTDGRFHVNLDASESLPPVEKYRTVVFKSRGQGLSQVRLFLESGAELRWRSAAVPVTAEWTEHRLQISGFEQQRRAGSGAWQRGGSDRPAGVQRLSFKVGYFMNEAGASGEVALSGLRFE